MKGERGRERGREKREGHHARRDRTAGVAAAAESRFRARMLDGGRTDGCDAVCGLFSWAEKEGPPSEGERDSADATVRRQHISVIWHMHKPHRQAFGVK